MSDKTTRIYHRMAFDAEDGGCRDESSNVKEHQCCCGHSDMSRDEANTAGATRMFFTAPSSDAVSYTYKDEASTYTWPYQTLTSTTDIENLKSRVDRLEKMHGVDSVPADDMDDVDEMLCDLEEILRTEGNEGYIFTIEALIDAIRSGDEDDCGG